MFDLVPFRVLLAFEGLPATPLRLGTHGASASQFYHMIEFMLARSRQEIEFKADLPTRTANLAYIDDNWADIGGHLLASDNPYCSSGSPDQLHDNNS